MIFSPFIHRFLYYYYIRFWPFCGVKIHKILLKYTIYSSYQSKNHYISHSVLMVHICLFFIKFMTYFDKSRLTFYVKQRQKSFSHILLIYNLFLYSLNDFSDVHIVRFPAIFTDLSVHRRICCIIFLYFICQMSFIELVFI